jgi:hypothetical protein
MLGCGGGLWPMGHGSDLAKGDWLLDDELRKALDELLQAELELLDSGGTTAERDSDDWFYSCAMRVVYAYGDTLNPMVHKESPMQTGIKFGLNPVDGPTIENVYENDVGP